MMRLVTITILLCAFSLLSHQAEASNKENRCRDFPAQQVMSDFQKEAVASIKTITERLLLVSIGIFSFIGSYLFQKKIYYTKLLMTSLGLFLLSASGGVLTIGEIVTQLSCNHFDPYHGPIAWYGLCQQGTIILAGAVFLLFTFNEIKRAKDKEGRD